MPAATFWLSFFAYDVGYGNTQVGFATWEGRSHQAKLMLRLGDQLTKAQIALINSGFSTYSALTVLLPEGKFTPETELAKIECTVKYDTWEETYDLARIDPEVSLTTARAFTAFVDTCLQVEIKHPTALQYFRQNGGHLWVHLRLDQISPDLAQNIRAWLIKQQSGVIKGLFSHMLGDMKLSEKTAIKFQIAPLQVAVDPTEEQEVMALYPQIKRGIQP